jgi:hypothetical protein
MVCKPHDFFAIFVLASFGLVRWKEKWSRGSSHCFTASTSLEGRVATPPFF